MKIKSQGEGRWELFQNRAAAEAKWGISPPERPQSALLLVKDKC